MDILDNLKQITERDIHGTLGLIAEAPQQLLADVHVENLPKTLPSFTSIVIAGMGGSALAADTMRDWLNLPLPFQVVKDYTLPAYVGSSTLVIVCSFSGNTEETLNALDDARSHKAHVVIAAGKGKLIEIAHNEHLPYIEMPYDGVTPRMFMPLNLRAFVEVFIAYGLLDSSVHSELASAAANLSQIASIWGPKVPYARNIAKQIAWHCAGKTPVIYAGSRFRSIAYKWKIAFNETAKNVAFCNELPEFNHNEFLGWTSHPDEKPYAVLALQSSFDHPRVTKRFTISDRLLSGMRPKAVDIHLEGETMIEQMIWGVVLADYTSIYLAILNGVEPSAVTLIEKFKTELANS